MILNMTSQNPGGQKPKLPSFNQLISNFDTQARSAQLSVKPKSQTPLRLPADSTQQSFSKFESLSNDLRNPPMQGGAVNRDETERELIRETYSFPPPPLPSMSEEHSGKVSQSHTRSLSSVRTSESNQQSLFNPNASLQEFHQHQSRPSMSAFPPAGVSGIGHHRKASSLNSIDTLRSVDYSASSPSSSQARQNREVELFYNIEKLLYSANLVQGVTNDIKNDLINHLQPADSKESVHALKFKYEEKEASIDFKSLNHFVNNIPTQLLSNTITEINKMCVFLEEWKSFKLDAETSNGTGLALFETRPNMSHQKRKSIVDTSLTRVPKKSASAGSRQFQKQTQTPPASTAQQEAVFIQVAHGPQSGGSSGSTSASFASTFSNITKRQATQKAKIKPKRLGLNEELSSPKKLVCVQCGETETPEWRRGPYGVRTLCNACGLFHGKLIKRFGVAQAAQVMADRRANGQGADRRIPNEDEEENP